MANKGAIGSGLQFWCDNKRHLVCTPYSLENLHRMAEILGIKRCWFHSGDKPHYDIPKRRQGEIKARCNIISQRALLKIISGETK